MLAPLVSIEGRLRPTVTVAMPEPPDGELARDLPPPDGSLVAEAHWLRTLVAGVPLAWWETTLGDGPDKLLGRRFEPADDLVAGWTRAAVAERNTAWAAALLRHTSDPGLWALAGAVSPDLVAEHLKRTDNGYERVRLLEALPRPWSPAARRRRPADGPPVEAPPRAGRRHRRLRPRRPAGREPARGPALARPHVTRRRPDAPPRPARARPVPDRPPIDHRGLRMTDTQPPADEVLRAHAETEFAAELAALADADDRPRPPQWRLSPWAVTTYLLGGTLADGTEITPKYLGSRRLMEIAVATLATDRALLLLGVPGTAKTWVSEHLSAAISGNSTLIVQGTAGTAEEAIRYGWNYARLLADGPSRDAMVAGPVMRAMEQGAIARVEELTRIPADVQDALITILSEKTLPIPELDDEVQARRGFNVIATANDRDKGVNDLSSALKRRFNTVILPLPDTVDQEVEIVRTRVASLGRALDLPAELESLSEIERVVTVFRELRSGATLDSRTTLKSPSATLSTAEAISVMTNGVSLAAHFGVGRGVGARRGGRAGRRGGEGPGAGRGGVAGVPRDGDAQAPGLERPLRRLPRAELSRRRCPPPPSRSSGSATTGRVRPGRWRSPSTSSGPRRW